MAIYDPRGKVDYPVYEFSTPRQYINAIYLRGAQMLQNLREDIGDPAFFAMLRSYYAAADLRIAEPAAVLASAEPAAAAQDRGDTARNSWAIQM